LGEETGGSRLAEGRYWAVDPMDGTTNFLHRFVGVSVALVTDGVPEIGAVHAPFLDRTWVGWRGGGAWIGRNA
jgi:myo-inositol-1(or 4)-monophosphatase